MFQIFEVNAASQRSGRQILSQLQEATQSHQVSKHSVSDVDGRCPSEGLLLIFHVNRGSEITHVILFCLVIQRQFVVKLLYYNETP